MGLRRVRAADSALCWSARRLAWAAALALAAAAARAPAQTLESVLRPGDVIAGHAKWEDDCAQCHVRFDRAAQDRLCMACHKDVGQDMRDRAGYHGRLKPQPCRSCHTDHRGRNARIVPLDQAAFDHATTDYALRGRHLEVDCAACHVPGRKWSQAPHECNACHRKDDVHKGSLGPQCADCHGEQAWKPARFDHGKTRFALTGKHARAKCDACHRDGKTRDLPRACAACHREDDRRAHQGRLGERCESCHDARAWRPASFNHDTATRFALRGKHRGVKCADCHGGAPANAPFAFAREKPGSACIDCHRKDDKHEGRLGADCASCHTERDWKQRGRFDHDKTAFALRGGHVQARCEACHKNANHRDTPKECVACHRNDDRHRGTLSTACADCHDERSWKSAPRFDHARTRFALRHAHALPAAPSVPGAGAGGGRGLTCQACHADATRMRGTPLDCASCHAKHDRHEGQLGPRCESCHDERSWKVAAFDHTRTRFALLGRHAQTACKDCHASPRFKDASRECAACHAKDDHHRGRFGTACESCHNPRHWALWHFDHAKRTRFVLEGAHATLACERCHGQPAPKGKAAAPLGDTCLACHRRDDVHDGAFGTACERCHTTERWKPVRPMRPHPAAASRAEPPAQGRRP